MRTWVKMLAWYTIVVVVLQVNCLSPQVFGGDPLADWEVVVGVTLAIPMLVFAILVLKVVRPR